MDKLEVGRFAIQQFWFPLGEVIVASFLIATGQCAILWARKKHNALRVIRYLQEHTENQYGKQFLTIASIAHALGLDVLAVRAVVEYDPRISVRKRDPEMIGLFPDEFNPYEAHRVITI